MTIIGMVAFRIPLHVYASGYAECAAAVPGTLGPDRYHSRFGYGLSLLMAGRQCGFPHFRRHFMQLSGRAMGGRDLRSSARFPVAL
jgi:hypothetical protein